MDFLFLMVCCGMASLPGALRKIQNGTVTRPLTTPSPESLLEASRLIRRGRKSKREFFHKPEFNIQTYSNSLSIELQPEIAPAELQKIKDQDTPPKQDPPVWDALKDLQRHSTQESQELLRSAIPGVDFPTLASIPNTSFSCDEAGQPGFYADAETGCQVFRRCDFRGLKWSYLCPNATLFNQITLVCDWFFNVDCSKTKLFYHYSNSRLYHPNWPLLDDQSVPYPVADASGQLNADDTDERLVRRKNGRRTLATTAQPTRSTTTTIASTISTPTQPAITMTSTARKAVSHLAVEHLRKRTTTAPVATTADPDAWRHRPFRLVWGGSYVS
ncbi:uncharacterized protein LOC129590905 [Paramacrobiotus metropolitanus]|uniref:uncharacterized protein LOC129590905 n=1 Tax=Paramacrobiotus metropolitanus TaxID=2943436 RepID=UPI002445F73A|nr:uncharacterized protein LOC129590905 [Paramacrobiotus metropolitanus]